MNEHEAPRFLHLTHSKQVTPELRAELVDCWETVTNTGGAVIAARFPLPPVTELDAGPAVDDLTRQLDPRRSRLLVATLQGVLAGWLVLHRDPHRLMAHCGTVNHVQTHPRFRRRGIGGGLMREAQQTARVGMGLERLRLSARTGLGLEDFYRTLGWVEVGRWSGALRVAPGDDRDEILMSLVL
ncbi:GNAT family N-acetyltransferase [Streptomyces hydrogenans]